MSPQLLLACCAAIFGAALRCAGELIEAGGLATTLAPLAILAAGLGAFALVRIAARWSRSRRLPWPEARIFLAVGLAGGFVLASTILATLSA